MTKSKKNIPSQTRRSRTKYAAIEKSTNLKTRQEAIDDVKTYFNELSESEKKWMNTFMEEYNNASFSHGEKHIHRSKKLKKDCYNRNNSRNRDISSIEDAKGMLNRFENLEDMEQEIQDNDYVEENEVWFEPKMKI